MNWSEMFAIHMPVGEILIRGQEQAPSAVNSLNEFSEAGKFITVEKKTGWINHPVRGV